MNIKLKIDPEFKAKIPPLTEEEFKQLEENILHDGEVYDPIVIWNGTIVDGHNRYKIIQANPWLEWRVREMKFADQWEAFDWMYSNQLGRRNLTDEQRAYLRGKQYEARKNSYGGKRGNQYTNLARDQNDLLANKSNPVAEMLAKEHHVGSATIKRDEKFAKGIDRIRETSPRTADEILAGNKKEYSKKDIRAVGSAEPEEQPNLIKAVIEGKPIPKQSQTPPPPLTPIQPTKPVDIRSKAGRQLMDRIRADVEEQLNGKTSELTLDAFAEMFGCDVQAMIERLEEVLSANKSLITKSIEKHVKSSIKQLCNLKEELQNV